METERIKGPILDVYDDDDDDDDNLIHNNTFIFKNIKLLQISNLTGSIISEYLNWCLIKQSRGVDKSLAPPGRKQANVLSEWSEFPSAPCRAGKGN